MTDFKTELKQLINRHSVENGSHTPDFILADYLTNCLKAFETAATARSGWYGHDNLQQRLGLDKPLERTK
jgi:hypothetical protein